MAKLGTRQQRIARSAVVRSPVMRQSCSAEGTEGAQASVDLPEAASEGAREPTETARQKPAEWPQAEEAPHSLRMPKPHQRARQRRSSEDRSGGIVADCPVWTLCRLPPTRPKARRGSRDAVVA
jgi:hypothetical protein